ncbi:DNA alkylation repair protein [Agromyces sp. LHK192]|uniref:DNA alkylation repair protein n=1 Tax=Agromyces sp. LHK192 TaxID=2498704 RepID=UPI000FDA87D2|nr:DNA alkylation repair protein [Agromyces sp. LHK192]
MVQHEADDDAGRTTDETDTSAALVDRLRALATDDQRVKYRRFFPGDDSFLGVRMGDVFDLAKQHLDLPVDDLERLLDRDEHEARVLACSIMGKSAAHRRTTDERRADLYDLYLRRHDRIDTWDLVDLAARDVVGRRLVDRDRDELRRLAASAFWPERRTALVATFAFIAHDDLDDAFELSATLADDDAPFVQKAVGWVLRTAGDRDPGRLTAFVESRAAKMPRDALRAAIEKLPKVERARILAIR